jgi:hypothetical protein
MRQDHLCGGEFSGKTPLNFNAFIKAELVREEVRNEAEDQEASEN